MSNAKFSFFSLLELVLFALQVKGLHGEQVWREAQRSQNRALPIGDTGPHDSNLVRGTDAGLNALDLDGKELMPSLDFFHYWN